MREAWRGLALTPVPLAPPQPLSSGRCQSEHRARAARTPLLPPGPVGGDPAPRPQQETGGPGPALHLARAAIPGRSSAASGTFQALVTFSGWLPARCRSRDDAAPPSPQKAQSPVLLGLARSARLTSPQTPKLAPSSSSSSSCTAPPRRPGEGRPHCPVIRGLWSQRNAGSCEPKHDTSPPPTPSPSARPPAAPAGPCPGGGAAPSLLSKPMRPLYVHKACIRAPVTKRGCLALLLMGASRAPRGDKGPPEPRGSGELNSAEEKRTREQNGAESHRTRCNARAIPVTVLKAQYFLSLLLEPNRGCRPAPHRTAGPSPSSPQV